MIFKVPFSPNHSVWSGIFPFTIELNVLENQQTVNHELCGIARYTSAVGILIMTYESCSTISSIILRIKNFRQEMSQVKACKDCAALLVEKSSLERS